MEKSWAAGQTRRPALVRPLHPVIDSGEPETGPPRASGLGDVIDALADAVIAVDETGRVNAANRAAHDILCYAYGDLLGRAVTDIIIVDNLPSPDFTATTNAELRTSNGDLIDAHVIPGQIGGAGAHASLLVLKPRSIKTAALKIAATLAELFATRHDLYLVVNPDATILASSPRLNAILDQASTRSLTDVLTADSRRRFDREARVVAEREGGWSGELSFAVRGGDELPLTASVRAYRSESGEIELYSLIGRDITDLKDTQARLAHLATHDSLTGLPNRDHFLRELGEAIERSRDSGALVCVILVDLDHFKLINDTHGHAAGDEYLRVAARRLRGAIRDQDTVARLGGDEFAVLCEGLADAQESEEIAHRLADTVARPQRVSRQSVVGTASIGIALNIQTGEAEELLRHADLATYAAKKQGRGRTELYSSRMHAESVRRLEIEQRLRSAIGTGELQSWYQPVIDLQRHSIVGLEALARWHQPDGTIIQPDEFMPMAEETGLIVPIGFELMRAAFEQTVAWCDEIGPNAPRVSINLSARQLNKTDLMEQLYDLFSDTGVRTSQLGVEITETALIDNVARSSSTLEELRSLGLTVAIDDFGTGQSSLSYLRRLPVDSVKIDRSFIVDIGADRAGTMIVAAIVSLAHALGLEVVAEGTETLEQVISLYGIDCDQGQGFFFMPPLAPHEITPHLRVGLPMPLTTGSEVLSIPA